jgi:hypothetical protein
MYAQSHWSGREGGTGIQLFELFQMSFIQLPGFQAKTATKPEGLKW